MSDNQNEPAQDQYEIELYWEIGAFLPERQNDWAEKGITAISERLSSSMFETLESTKRYWSVPERLLDIRILMLFRDSLIGEQAHNIEDRISILRRIQFELYLIVFRFAEWCYTFAEADQQLHTDNRISKNRQKSIDQLRSAYVTYFGLDALSKMHVDGDYKLEYRDTYHDILENVAKKACTEINTRFTPSDEINTSFTHNYETNMNKLLDELKKIAVKLGIYSPNKDTFDKYFDDCSRCVALLMFLPENQPGNQNLQPKSQYLAFSGFFDSEDTGLPEEFNPEPKLADEFKQISKGYGAKLVTLTRDIVDRISTYMIDEDFSLIKSKTLREAVEEAKENATAQNVNLEDKKISKRYYSPIKKEYSCCERKMLAAIGLSEEQSGNAKLLVKFQPCFNCYAALKEWKKTNNIKLKVHYIPKKLYEDGNTLSASSETLIDPSTNLD